MNRFEYWSSFYNAKDDRPSVVKIADDYMRNEGLEETGTKDIALTALTAITKFSKGLHPKVLHDLTKQVVSHYISVNIKY